MGELGTDLVSHGKESEFFFERDMKPLETFEQRSDTI